MSYRSQHYYFTQTCFNQNMHLASGKWSCVQLGSPSSYWSELTRANNSNWKIRWTENSSYGGSSSPTKTKCLLSANLVICCGSSPNRLDPDQARQNTWPDLDPKCLTLVVSRHNIWPDLDPKCLTLEVLQRIFISYFLNKFVSV